MLSTIKTKTNGAAKSRKHASQADNNLSDQKIAEAMTMTIRELNPEVTVETDFLRDSVAPMQLGNIDDAKKTAKGIAEYCAKNKVKKFGLGDLMNLSWAPKESKSEATVLGAHFSKDKSVVPTFEPEDMAGLVIGEMENSDFNPEMTEECHDHLKAFFFDEGEECRTLANAKFVARRILCESRINGSDCVFDSEDFSESQGSYGPSEEAWDKYIEPQAASL